MNNVARIAGSWFIWGLSYYLYYPFVSLYVVKFVKDVTLVYLISAIFAIPLPLIGGKLARKIGLVKTMILGGIISGIGLIMVGLAKDLLLLIVSYIITSSFFLALPSYYSYMNNLGKGTISVVWAISILPSLFTPYIGGVIASLLGLREVFIIAGIIMIFTGIPLLGLEEINVKNEKVRLNYKILIPILVILPIALAFPFIYLVLRENYSMSYEEIGEIATLAELLGAFFTFLYSRFERKFLLSVYLFLFSLASLVYVNPFFSVFFGLWEAIIPSALEESREKSPEAFGLINSMQQFGWLIGYLASYLAFSARLSLLASSVLALILGLSFLFIRK